MPPTRQSTFEVKVSDKIAVSLSSMALSMMNATVDNQGAGTILAKKSFSFLSNGEFIEVHIIPIRPDQSKISIMSKSAWVTTLIDWGVNAKNIERFEQLVRQLTNLVKLLEKQKT